MVFPNDNLVFPRGSTFDQDVGDSNLSATRASELLGQIFESDDTENDTGERILLRLVQNNSGGVITVARKLYYFGTGGLLEWGRKIDGEAFQAGMVCKPMDDAYPVGKEILANDYFYVVERGLCKVQLEPTTVALSAGDAIATDAQGFVNGAVAAAGEYVVGQIMVDAAVASVIALFRINSGLFNTEA